MLVFSDCRSVSGGPPSSFNQVVLLFAEALVPKKAQSYCYIYSLRRNQDPVPRQHHCLLTAPPWPLHPLLSPMSSCPLLKENHGRRSLFPKNKKWSTQKERFMPRSPQGPAWLQTHSCEDLLDVWVPFQMNPVCASLCGGRTHNCEGLLAVASFPGEAAGGRTCTSA